MFESEFEFKKRTLFITSTGQSVGKCSVLMIFLMGSVIAAKLQDEGANAHSTFCVFSR